MRRIAKTMPRPPSGLIIGGIRPVKFVPLLAGAAGVEYRTIGVFKFFNTNL
jgi:hypothetical protein